MPVMAESMRSNYTEGFPLVQADPREDLHSTSRYLALSLKCFAWKHLEHSHLADAAPRSGAALAEKITTPSTTLSQHQATTATTLSTALEPLAATPDSPRSGPSSHITTLDGPLRAVATDVAPYVRAIVAYDLRLEAQRRALSNLLSQGGGRAGAKARTTRASRAALEGGSKAHTRRERWFPKGLDFPMVLRTGGEGWGELALAMEGPGAGAGAGAGNGTAEGSRRSSAVSSGTV